jgi:hypothetical protein
LKNKTRKSLLLMQIQNQLKKKLGANYEESMVVAELM